MDRNLFSVGYHKGEMDFGVNSSVSELTHEQMRELRKMIVVGIGVMESMWRRNKPQPGSAEQINNPSDT